MKAMQTKNKQSLIIAGVVEICSLSVSIVCGTNFSTKILQNKKPRKAHLESPQFLAQFGTIAQTFRKAKITNENAANNKNGKNSLNFAFAVFNCLVGVFIWISGAILAVEMHIPSSVCCIRLQFLSLKTFVRLHVVFFLFFTSINTRNFIG